MNQNVINTLWPDEKNDIPSADFKNMVFNRLDNFSVSTAMTGVQQILCLQ